MAKSSHKLDEVFKEKLDQHSIKPSVLAWERLERKLPKETKTYKVYWWAAAASVVILLSAGYFLYPVISSNPGETMLATNQEVIIPEEKEETISTNPENIAPKEINDAIEEELENTSIPSQVQENPKKEINKEKPSNTQPKITEEVAPKNLIAMTETREEKEEITQVIIPEEKLETKPLVEPTMELPTLNLKNAVAENTSTKVEEPAYRVKIFSDGLKEEPKDKSLIAGIGKTVNEVGGLLGKVDQGFADLQDAKNNLFTNLTSKKEQADK
ncbi:hypothetical protein [Algoriphagus sp.]|uniref:hypothetical protein n=1 Tax=Algoriphagus sp. TaxID=1872435 RepID=UPI0025FEDC84|nr:hypothetical protein [Algoriphagus sp.]